MIQREEISLLQIPYYDPNHVVLVQERLPRRSATLTTSTSMSPPMPTRTMFVIMAVMVVTFMSISAAMSQLFVPRHASPVFPIHRICPLLCPFAFQLLKLCFAGSEVPVQLGWGMALFVHLFDIPFQIFLPLLDSSLEFARVLLHLSLSQSPFALCQLLGLSLLRLA